MASNKNTIGKTNKNNGHNKKKQNKIKYTMYYPSNNCDNITFNYICRQTRGYCKLKFCGGCKLKFYCSKTCQKYHWKYVHRLECEKIQQRLAGKCCAPTK